MRGFALWRIFEFCGDNDFIIKAEKSLRYNDFSAFPFFVTNFGPTFSELSFTFNPILQRTDERQVCVCRPVFFPAFFAIP